MQNQPNPAGPDGPGLLDSPLAALAQPKVVLMAAGGIGLAIDLLVRPLSWVGLVLIVLATLPWTLQAWSDRGVRKAERDLKPAPPNPRVVADPTARPRPEPGIVAGAEAPASARPRQPAPAPAPAPARQPAAAARAPGGEPRPVPARPQRFADAPPAARPLRPETAG